MIDAKVEAGWISYPIRSHLSVDEMGSIKAMLGTFGLTIQRYSYDITGDFSGRTHLVFNRKITIEESARLTESLITLLSKRGSDGEGSEAGRGVAGEGG